MLRVLEFMIALFAFTGHIAVLYLTYRMIKFASQYGKPWANAFKVYFVAMTICALRRGAIVLLVGGWTEIRESILVWDRFISNPILTALYLIFLIILVGWWKEFFDNLNLVLKTREAALAKREEAVEIREKLIVEHPNGVEVDEPKKVIVDVGEKKVFAESPKKVIILNPKNIIETKSE